MAILVKHRMIPSMSRPANPCDNASCDSFIKTLKREETYARKYEYLEHLRGSSSPGLPAKLSCHSEFLPDSGAGRHPQFDKPAAET